MPATIHRSETVGKKIKIIVDFECINLGLIPFYYYIVEKKKLFCYKTRNDIKSLKVF